MHKCGARRNPGLFVFAVSKVGPPKETVSSDEGMLAGGDCICGDCTPAKPLWSEVIIFWLISSGERIALWQCHQCGKCGLHLRPVGADSGFVNFRLPL